MMNLRKSFWSHAAMRVTSSQKVSAKDSFLFVGRVRSKDVACCVSYKGSTRQNRSAPGALLCSR